MFALLHKTVLAQVPSNSAATVFSITKKLKMEVLDYLSTIGTPLLHNPFKMRLTTINVQKIGDVMVFLNIINMDRTL